MPTSLRCLVTGATGYIGGRLVPELLGAGFAVRCLARDPGQLGDHRGLWTWRSPGGVLRPGGGPAGVPASHVAYYLIHSLDTGAGFEEIEADSARAFSAAARRAGVSRIVYLGGLVPDDVPVGELSQHLRSRMRVGEILRESGVPTVELRAAVIIGSGSASFEMVRYLTERLPVMVTPRWVRVRVQPIAVRDVLRYLVGVGNASETRRSARPGCSTSAGRSPDLSGDDAAVRAGGGVAAPADRAGAVADHAPVSLWVGAVTPVPASIARPLVESLRHEVVCRDRGITALVPDPPQGLIDFDEAVRLARTRIRNSDVATRWASASLPARRASRCRRTRAGPAAPCTRMPGSSFGRRRRRRCGARWRASAGRPAVFLPSGLGRARLARPAQRRRRAGPGRRDPRTLRLGDTLDFWRVEAIDRGRLLRLRAEMKMPGLGWLELSASRDDQDRTVYHQRAIFQPRGAAGIAYWRSISPFHGAVFGGMVKNIADAAERGGTWGAATAETAAPR